MRFKVDENLADDVAALLAADGHDAMTVYDQRLRGCKDSALIKHCLAEDRALVTFDQDFADIRAFPPSSTAGIVVLRLNSQSRRHVLHVMSRVLDLLKREQVTGRMWIVSDAGVRIRGA